MVQQLLRGKVYIDFSRTDFQPKSDIQSVNTEKMSDFYRETKQQPLSPEQWRYLESKINSEEETMRVIDECSQLIIMSKNQEIKCKPDDGIMTTLNFLGIVPTPF